jgi:hypothetical protein
MRYILQEIGTKEDGSIVLSDPKTFDDKNKAESEFHKILQYAAVSTMPKKGCMLFTSDGEVVRSEFYDHPVQSAEPTKEETNA